VFPSGTATAQLISVLHDGSQDKVQAYVSPSGSRITRRRGYEALPSAPPTEALFTRQDTERNEEASTEAGDATIGKEQNYHDVIQSWRILGLSFGASTLLTVRCLYGSEPSRITNFCILALLVFFPSGFQHPFIWCIPRARMAVVFFS
jgi:hypothetical protein